MISTLLALAFAGKPPISDHPGFARWMAHKLVWLSNMMCIYGSMRHWSDRWLDSVVFFSSSSSSSSLERESS